MKWLVLTLVLFSLSSLAEPTNEELGFGCTYESVKAAARKYDYKNESEQWYKVYLSALKNCPTESLSKYDDLGIWSGYYFVSAALKSLDISLMQKLLDAGFDINFNIYDVFGYGAGTILTHAVYKYNDTEINFFEYYFTSEKELKKRYEKLEKIKAFIQFLVENGGTLEPTPTGVVIVDRIFEDK